MHPEAAQPDPERATAQILRIAQWIFYALLLLMGASVVSADFLPIFDLPQHYSISAILSSYFDPAMGWAEDYRIRDDFIPYVFIYYFAAYLGKVIGIKWAMKVLIAYCVLGFPLAINWLLKLYQRPRWLALLALPLAYHFSFSMGFVASCVTINTTLLCAAFTHRQLQSFSITYFPIAALCGFVVATSHALGVVTFIPIIAAMLIFAPSATSRIRRALNLTVLLIPIGILGYYVFAPKKPSGGLAGWDLLKRVFSSLSSPQKNIAAIKTRFLNQFHDGTDQVVLLAILLIVIVYVAQCLWRRGATGQKVDWSLRIIVPGLALLYFLIPFTASLGQLYIWGFNIRILPLLAAFLLLLWRSNSVAKIHMPLAIAAVLVAAVYVGKTAIHTYRFDQEARQGWSLINELPRKSRLLQLIDAPLHGPVFDMNAYLTVPYYATGLLGLRLPGMFAENPQSLVRSKFGKSLPRPNWKNHRHFRFSQHSRGYDYILTFHQGKRRHAFFRGHEKQVRKVSESGGWKLFSLKPGG